ASDKTPVRKHRPFKMNTSKICRTRMEEGVHERSPEQDGPMLWRMPEYSVNLSGMTRRDARATFETETRRSNSSCLHVRASCNTAQADQEIGVPGKNALEREMETGREEGHPAGTPELLWRTP